MSMFGSVKAESLMIELENVIKTAREMGLEEADILKAVEKWAADTKRSAQAGYE